jgi:urea transporter
MTPLSQQLASAESVLPAPIRAGLRGIGQVFFQENALTGACFLVGIAISSPLMGLGALIGTAIGTAVGHFAKFDRGEVAGGIYGFNATLVGIATFFFFQPGAASIGLLVVGCVVATLVTMLMRRFLPFPTYTTPFILTTWAIFLLAPALGAVAVVHGEPTATGSGFRAVANGIGQVMFQANLITALLFVVGIALSDWRHAVWVVIASAMGALVANFHVTPAQKGPDPETLVGRYLSENIELGLYGYNATLPAIALFLWRRSFIPAFLGIFLSVPLTELVPMMGLPALTAPFVLATWIVLALGFFDEKFLRGRESPPA